VPITIRALFNGFYRILPTIDILCRREIIKKPNKDGGEHTAPWECTFAKEEKSTCKPGITPESDSEYFEILCLCILQAGLGWGMVRNNWAKYKKGFLDFDFNRLAKSKTEDIMANPGVIKNKRKISAIIKNAGEIENIIKEYGSFFEFLESLRKKDEDEVIFELSHRFSHLGEYSAEYFLHSIGFWD
jgi:DNA-3-methyladenine glycosylase I